MSKEELRILIAVHRIANDLDRKTSRLLMKHDITLGQFAVLECLYHKGDLSVGEVQDKILSTSGTITIIIDNLVKRGFIERCRKSTDRRSFILHLTEEGRTLISKVYPENEEMIINELDIYTEEEKTQLVGLLSKYKEKKNDR